MHWGNWPPLARLAGAAARLGPARLQATAWSYRFCGWRTCAKKSQRSISRPTDCGIRVSPHGAPRGADHRHAGHGRRRGHGVHLRRGFLCLAGRTGAQPPPRVVPARIWSRPEKKAGCPGSLPPMRRSRSVSTPAPAPSCSGRRGRRRAWYLGGAAVAAPAALASAASSARRCPWRR